MTEEKKCISPKCCFLADAPFCDQCYGDFEKKALVAQAREIFKDILTPKIWYSLGSEKGFMIPFDRFNAFKKKYGVAEEEMLRGINA